MWLLKALLGISAQFCVQSGNEELLTVSGKQAVSTSMGSSIPGWQHGECFHFISIQTKGR